MGLYFLLIGVLFTFGLVFDIVLFYYVSYLCIGLYVASRWYVPRALEQLNASRSLLSHAFLGDEIAITLSLTNPGRWFLPWVSVWDSVPLELTKDRNIMQVLTLRPRSRAKLSYAIKPKRRGYYRLGPMYLASGDLFGFAPQVQTQRPISHITVYPRVSQLNALGLPSRLPFGTLPSQQQIFSDPTRPMGIREYQVGDSQRHIHWKTSGHLRRLVVKTFEPAVSLETVIMLDLHREDYDAGKWRDGSEFAIEVAASVAAHLSQHRQAVGLQTNGIDPIAASASFDPSSGRLESSDDAKTGAFTSIAPRSGKAQLMRILESLARVQAADSMPFADWVWDASIGLSWGVTVLAVTPSCDERTCNVIHRLMRSGFNPLLIVTEPVYFAPVQARARQLGFRAYRVTDRRELSDWRDTRGY